MKKLVAVWMCLTMMLSLFSCRIKKQDVEETVTTNGCTSDQKKEEPVTTNDQKGEEQVTTDAPLSLSNEIALQMYEAAIKGEICIFDERMGEVKLKDLRFASNSTRLEECKLLKKAILDVDQDGVNEYVIQSPNQEYIILRYYNGKVYSYWLDVCDYYDFNTDGTFYWCNSPNTAGTECGLNKIVFSGETLNVKSIYGLKYSKHPDVYLVEGKAVTEAEYYDYRAAHCFKESMKFSQFEPDCSYPITAEQAWNLANAYWDNQDGCTDGGAGTIWTVRIVLTDAPNFQTGAYRVAFQVDWNSNGGREGYECLPPYSVKEHDQILVNAFTGEITTPAYEADGKCISVEEAIEIAKNHCGKTYYAEIDAKEAAPNHIYVVVFYHDVNHSDVYTRVWVDKHTGEVVFPYYVYGK